MFSLDSSVQITRVEANPELAVALALMDKAVYPVRWLTLSHLLDDALLFHRSELLFDFFFQGNRHLSWAVNDWCNVRIKGDMIGALQLTNAIETFWKLTQNCCLVDWRS